MDKLLFQLSNNLGVRMPISQLFVLTLNHLNEKGYEILQKNWYNKSRKPNRSRRLLNG